MIFDTGILFNIIFTNSQQLTTIFKYLQIKQAIIHSSFIKKIMRYHVVVELEVLHEYY